MTLQTVIEMMTAAIIIGIILVGGGSRMYFRKKFNVSEHFEALDQAIKRQEIAKRKMHNVQNH